MDFEKLADEFIEEGGWQGSPRIAIELFAKWLAEHEAAQPRVQPTDETCANCGRPLNGGACAPCLAPSLEDFVSG